MTIDWGSANLQGDMPAHLRVTGDACGRVSTALVDFAVKLASLQNQMRPVAQRPPRLWQALQAAQGRVQRAATADERHQRDRKAHQDSPTTADGAAVPDSYQSDTTAAGTALSTTQREWQNCVNTATGLRGRLATAVAASVRQIRTAASVV